MEFRINYILISGLLNYKNNPIHPVFTFGQPLSVDLLCPPVQKLNISSGSWEGLHGLHMDP